MQRIQQLDLEIMRCIQTLNDIVPFSTVSGNLNMVYAADMVIRGLSQYHAEKMAILQQINTESALRFEIPAEEQDSGPLQLADLMIDTPMDSPPSIRQYPAYSPVGPSSVGNNLSSIFQEEDTLQTIDMNDPDWIRTDNEPMDDETSRSVEVEDMPLPVYVTTRRTRRCIRLRSITVEDAQNQHSCQVCFETPDFANTYLTSCGHSFCKECFEKWEHACINNDDHVTCPTCRARRPHIRLYKNVQPRIFIV